MSLYAGFLKAIGRYEPSMDELISLVGPTPFDQGFLCLLGAVIVVFAVYILHKIEHKPRWLDDLVIAFLLCLLLSMPFIFCEMPSFLTPQNYTWQLVYYAVSGVSFVYNMYRFSKYTKTQPKIALKTICGVQKLFPSKEDLSLGDRIKELASLIVFVFIAVLSYRILFHYFGKFVPYLLLISILMSVCIVWRDLDTRKKSA